MNESVHRLQVRFAETDLMGVVHHAGYLLYCEAGRVDWLHKRGVSYADWAHHGVHLPVAEAKLRYKAPARFDEVIDVCTSVARLSRAAVRFAYRIEREGQLLCEAETLLACVNDDMKLVRMPPNVMRTFETEELPPDRWASRV